MASYGGILSAGMKIVTFGIRAYLAFAAAVLSPLVNCFVIGA